MLKILIFNNDYLAPNSPELSLQWTLAYLALDYPAARIIRPQYFGSCVVKNGYKKHTCVSSEAKLHIIIRLKEGESQSIVLQVNIELENQR